MVRAERVAHLIKRMEAGHKLTTDDVNRFYNHTLNTVVDLRSSQRDFADIQNFDSRVKILKYRGRKYIHIPKVSKRIIPEPDIVKNELLSLYILKAHLNAFKNTEIEEDVSSLINKLEELYPEDIYSTDSLYWDQNFGKFNYANYSGTINTIIEHILEKNCVNVYYKRTTGQKESSFRCYFRCFFQYNGGLYVAAYVPFYKHDIALSVQYIDKMRKVLPEETEIPNFDFKEFTKYRFGVFYGKQQRVVLKINKDVKQYFENRDFHETQEFFDDSGDLVLTMDVPLSPELETWIMGWIDSIQIMQPDRLRKAVLKRIEKGIENLKGE